MVFEANYQYRIKKRGAWIRGKKGNEGNIPTDIAEITDVLYVNAMLSYKVEYENGRVGYIALDELQHCEIFALAAVVDKETVVTLP